MALSEKFGTAELVLARSELPVEDQNWDFHKNLEYKIKVEKKKKKTNHEHKLFALI